jgi:ADP-heptose:LPS heptosyltransferase
VGYDRKWGFVLTHRVPDHKALGERHEVEYNLQLAAAAGVSVSTPPWRFPPFQHEQAEVQQLLGRHGVPVQTPLLAVHPWTSNPSKRWPMERFRRLLEDLSQQFEGFSVVVIGGPQEQGVGRALLSPPIPRVVNLIGLLSITQLAALLEAAWLLISNDSGPVHLAAAVGTRTVVLFGVTSPATSPKRWGPWGDIHTVISKRSLQDIQVDEVTWIVDWHLKKQPSATSSQQPASA